MESNAEIAQPAQVPRNHFRDPQNNSREQEQDRRVKHDPEKELLPIVEAPYWRKFFVLAADVICDILPPRAIGIRDDHVIAPELVHIKNRHSENHAHPEMPKAR